MTGQLFLSHAHPDKTEAQALRRALEDSGIKVWEDVLGLRAGDGLGDLEKAVKGSRGLLLLWTPAANESEWVERETGWARQAREENPEYRILVVLRGGGRVSAKRLLGEELVFIQEAEARLKELTQAGNDSAAQMLAAAAGSLGDALRAMGRFNEAVEAQERGIAISDQWGNRRDSAVGRLQLGTIRLFQGRLQDALAAYEQARSTFEELYEPETLAGVWHQLGVVHQELGSWDRAEEAYQKALRIEVELGKKSRQAITLDQLGLLYRISGHLEESAQLHLQASTLYEELGDSLHQAYSLSSLEMTLVEQDKRLEYDDAVEFALLLEALGGSETTM